MEASYQVMMAVLFTELLYHGLNANSFTWFEAQEKCQSSGSEIVTFANISKCHWTSYYQRESQWIGIYGCHMEKSLNESKKQNFSLPSAGRCQEFCMKSHKMTELLFFAIKNKTCICLNNCPGRSTESGCSFSCLENMSTSPKVSECGEESAYSVFYSRKYCTSKEIPQPSKSTVCRFENNHLNAVNNNCSSICENNTGQCSVDLTRQVYISNDEGQNFTDMVKENILKCQLCNRCSGGCQFAHCNETTPQVFCSNGKTFPVRHSTQLQSRTTCDNLNRSMFRTLAISTKKFTTAHSKSSKATKVTRISSPKHFVDSTQIQSRTNNLNTSIFRTLGISTKKFTTAHSKSSKTKKVTRMVSSTKYFVDSTSHVNNVSSTIAIIQNPVNNGSEDDLLLHVGIMTSTIGISIMCLGVFAYCMRKRYGLPNNTGHALPKSTSTSHNNGTEERSMESNSRSQHIRPSTQNYPYSYSFVDKNKFELNNFRQEDQYHPMGQPALKCIANEDIYTKPDINNSNKENVHFDGGENHYNCLRENMCLNYEEEDTYSHAQNVDTSNSSNYDVVNIKRNSGQIIGENLYDHFES